MPNNPGSFAPGPMMEEDDAMIQERGRDLLARKIEELDGEGMEEEGMEYYGWNSQEKRSC